MIGGGGGEVAEAWLIVTLAGLLVLYNILLRTLVIIRMNLSSACSEENMIRKRL